jgi:copper chaperone NosL
MYFFNKNITTVTLAAMLLLGFGCAEKSSDRISSDKQSTVTEQINYETDICAFTGDLIETVRYGGRIVMKDGTVYNFMSVECTAGFYLGLEDKNKIESMKIVDFVHGKQLLPVDELVYLKSTLRPSPNGLFLSAVDASNEKMKTFVYDAYPGPYLEWEEVLELVNREWNIEETSTRLNTNY